MSQKVANLDYKDWRFKLVPISAERSYGWPSAPSLVRTSEEKDIKDELKWRSVNLDNLQTDRRRPNKIAAKPNRPSFRTKKLVSSGSPLKLPRSRKPPVMQTHKAIRRLKKINVFSRSLYVSLSSNKSAHLWSTLRFYHPPILTPSS